MCECVSGTVQHRFELSETIKVERAAEVFKTARSLVEEGGELVSQNDLFLRAVCIDGDHIGDAAAGAVTVHGQSQSCDTHSNICERSPHLR